MNNISIYYCNRRPVMIQKSKYDKLVIERIENEEVFIDANSGKIYGKILDGKDRKEIGHFIGEDKYFTILRDGKSISYPVCRAVYLSVHMKINHGLEVCHINKDKSDNRISNLFVRVGKNRKECLRWKNNENSELLSCYKDMSYGDLAIKFNRSEKSIRQKIRHLHLSKKDRRKNWTEDDDKKLLDLYGDPSLTIESITKIMHKSQSSIRLRANRKGNLYRSDRHLRDNLSESGFYLAIRGANLRNSLQAKCCLCDYDKYIDLHHNDGNNKNNHISNIATLCPNHHREVTNGEHKDKILYSIWRRKYSDGKLGPLKDNINEVKSNQKEKGK